MRVRGLHAEKGLQVRRISQPPNRNGMKVLSLFDGMSCGQIALKQLGIRLETYYASEIDQHAIRQTQLNFPETIQLGDVTQVDVRQLEPIDLLIGGSPCQSFSFAGKRAGMSTTDKEEIHTLERYLELKREGFRFEGESYLFWEYMRILTDIRKYNPDVLFLLENVEMGKKWERVLSEAIGIFGVHINSVLVSAQNRKRIYWTNIRTKKVGLFGELHSDIPKPKDRHIQLTDILESHADSSYFLPNKALKKLLNNGHGIPDLSLLRGGSRIVCGAMRGRESVLSKNPSRTAQRLFVRNDGKTNCLTTVEKDNLVCEIQSPYERNSEPSLHALYGVDARNNRFCLRVRRFTPIECARLQTIPEWYQWKCSKMQQYRMLGNGWTVEVIVHIFSFLKDNIHINIQNIA